MYLLQGLLSRKKNRFSEAADYFKQGANTGDNVCMYKYGEMRFLGEGTKKNSRKAFHYFKKSSENGFEKSEYFLTSYKLFNDLNEFSTLPAETQLLLIKSNIKNLISNDGDVKHILGRYFNYIFFDLQLDPKINGHQFQTFN